MLLAGTVLVAGIGGWLATRRLQACGPFGVEAAFRDPLVPDTSREEALAGHLGILRPGLPAEHLVLAYRHLAGLPVASEAWTVAEAASPTPDASPEACWQRARARVPGLPRLASPDRERRTEDYQFFTHVGDHALRHAAAILEARLAAHGSEPNALRAWVEGQDLVFQSRPGACRMPESVEAPAWLRQDRAYQRAAALFYADRWGEAREAFSALAADATSPWRNWGAYLQARCWVRQASLGPATEAPEALVKAQRHLEGLLKDPRWADRHADARAYLEHVRFLREPEALEAEALATLAAPRLGPGEGRAALVVLEEARRAMEQRRIAPLSDRNPAASDLRLWLELLGKGREPGRALSRADRGLPWLVAALATLPAGAPEAARLKATAEAQPARGPAQPSLAWHLLRQELALCPPEALTARVQKALADPWPRWAANELRALGRAHARDLAAWASCLASQVTAVEGEGLAPSGRVPELPEATARRYGPDPRLLEPEVAEQLNRWLPLEAWVQLAERPALPAPLRQDLAQAAWVRACLLHREHLERRLRPALEDSLRTELPAVDASPDACTREFRLALLMMRHPGLSPLLHGGMGRALDGWAPLTEVVDFGTNWWCLSDVDLERTQPPAFLSSAEREAANRDWGALGAAPSARHAFARAVLAQAERHPEDPELPYALHRMVRLTRNADCYDRELSEQGRRCFRILHARFPKNPWTRKTPVHY